MVGGANIAICVFVCLSVCLFACLSVCWHISKIARRDLVISSVHITRGYGLDPHLATVQYVMYFRFCG